MGMRRLERGSAETVTLVAFAILTIGALVGVNGADAVGLHSASQFLSDAGALVPFLAFGMAITVEPNLRQASSQYRDLPFEDVLDMLDRVDAANTPLFSMAKRGKELGNTEFSTEVDSWPAPQGAVGYADKYPVQATEIMNNALNRRKVGNGGQAFRRAGGAGWIAEQVPMMPGTGKGFMKLCCRFFIYVVMFSKNCGS